MKRLTGIRAVLLRRARLSVLPSSQGPCEVDRKSGVVRYFVAAKLPKPVYLCDEHYKEVRDSLEEVLKGVIESLLKEAEA